jgi:hypothetical protein
VTSTVSFHFDSPQFEFRSGFIAFTKGARLNSIGGISTGELSNGSIDGVVVEGPIEFDAMLYQLSVSRKADHHSYFVTGLWASRAMTLEEIRAGRIAVTLNLPLVIRVQVIDSSGARVPAVVSLFFPSLLPRRGGGATLEVPVDGELVLFGTPGYHHVGLISAGDRSLPRKRAFEQFEVSPEDTGERVIVLRVPPERRG